MNTLVISDIHEPFSHPRAIAHCKMVGEKYNAKKVVFVGDIIDHHRISRHVSEPDSFGATVELRLTKRKLKKWIKAFPTAHILLGNHDLIPYRQAKELGMPKAFLKDLHKVYNIPSLGWKFSKRLILGNVLYLHNAGSGKYAAINKAKEMSMSVVCGHTHRHGGVIYFSNPRQLFFGMNVGCLIDKSAYAMRYFEGEPTCGCGVVINSELAYFEPMKMGR